MTPLPSSPRLSFRCWTVSDLILARTLWADPRVMRYMGGPLSPDAIASRLQLEITRQQTLGIQYWPIFTAVGADFAGCAGLRPFHEEPQVYEVGVHLAPAVWSQRLGEEAARAVIDHAFHTLAALAVTAGHNPDNKNSQALVSRLGFTYTHHERWGPDQSMHPFYRLERPPAPHAMR